MRWRMGPPNQFDFSERRCEKIRKAQFSSDAAATGINDRPVRALANALRTTRCTFIVSAIL